MFVEKRLIQEAQERASRVRDLASRLEHMTCLLHKYRTQADLRGPDAFTYEGKISWLLQELPGRRTEFDEANRRLQLTLEAIQKEGRPSSHPRAVPA